MQCWLKSIIGLVLWFFYSLSMTIFAQDLASPMTVRQQIEQQSLQTAQVLQAGSQLASIDLDIQGIGSEGLQGYISAMQLHDGALSLYVSNAHATHALTLSPWLLPLPSLQNFSLSAQRHLRMGGSFDVLTFYGAEPILETNENPQTHHQPTSVQLTIFNALPHTFEVAPQWMLSPMPNDSHYVKLSHYASAGQEAEQQSYLVPIQQKVNVDENWCMYIASLSQTNTTGGNSMLGVVSEGNATQIDGVFYRCKLLAD